MRRTRWRHSAYENAVDAINAPATRGTGLNENTICEVNARSPNRVLMPAHNSRPPPMPMAALPNETSVVRMAPMRGSATHSTHRMSTASTMSWSTPRVNTSEGSRRARSNAPSVVLNSAYGRLLCCTA